MTSPLGNDDSFLLAAFTLAGDFELPWESFIFLFTKQEPFLVSIEVMSFQLSCRATDLLEQSINGQINNARSLTNRSAAIGLRFIPSHITIRIGFRPIWE